jgi:hypothetical protein
MNVSVVNSTRQKKKFLPHDYTIKLIGTVKNGVTPIENSKTRESKYTLETPKSKDC